MSKEVKRYDPFGYDGLSALMHEDADGGWVRIENYEALRLELAEANADFVRIANEREALLAERDALREALNFSCKSLCQVTSADGSGHADIALSVLRLAGVDADERESLVEGWKVNVQWRIDRAALQGEQP